MTALCFFAFLERSLYKVKSKRSTEIVMEFLLTKYTRMGIIQANELIPLWV